jgi:ribosome-binding protein aMBF1 (putative translation factor)
MGKTVGRCEACGEAVVDAVGAVAIEGRELLLCEDDRARLGSPLPRTLRRAQVLLAPSKLERRRHATPRRKLDRRMFPRPEGRRLSGGRRRTDPKS